MKGSIMEEGLTEGAFPHFEGDKLTPISRCQWLTADPDPRRQSWATSILINYSRTAYRLTVNIPDSHRKKLIRATDFVKDMLAEDQKLVTGWAGSESWYIFRGIIPVKWIIGCHRMGGANHV